MVIKLFTMTQWVPRFADLHLALFVWSLHSSIMQHLVTERRWQRQLYEQQTVAWGAGWWCVIQHTCWDCLKNTPFRPEGSKLSSPKICWFTTLDIISGWKHASIEQYPSSCRSSYVSIFTRQHFKCFPAEKCLDGSFRGIDVSPNLLMWKSLFVFALP